MANITAPDAHRSFARKLTNMVRDSEDRHIKSLADMLREAPDAAPQGARFILGDLASPITTRPVRLNSGSLAHATRGVDEFKCLEHFMEHADAAVAIAEATIRAKGHNAKLDVTYSTETDYQGKTYWNAQISLTDPSKEAPQKAARCG